MKVIAKVTSGLAIDCRTNVHFKKDDVLEVGSGSTRFSTGLSEEDLVELVTLDLADEVKETGTEEVDAVEAEVEEDSEVEEPEYMSFTKKADLETYAQNTYDINLDRRLTLKGMIEQLESELGGEL